MMEDNLSFMLYIIIFNFPNIIMIFFIGNFRKYCGGGGVKLNQMCCGVCVCVCAWCLVK